MRSELAHQQELREQVILFLFETWRHDAQSHLLVPADSPADRSSTLHGLRDPGPHLVQFSALSLPALRCGPRDKGGRGLPANHSSSNRIERNARGEIAPEPAGHGLPLSKCEAYNRVYEQSYGQVVSPLLGLGAGGRSPGYLIAPRLAAPA
jgi:hypothetical protein